MNMDHEYRREHTALIYSAPSADVDSLVARETWDISCWQ